MGSGSARSRLANARKVPDRVSFLRRGGTGTYPLPLLFLARAAKSEAQGLRTAEDGFGKADVMASEDRSGTWLRYSHLGIQFCLTFGAFVGLGMWGDSRLDWSPWLTIAGCMVGMTVATYLLVKETSSKRP
jgi:hypothetical protein